MTGIFYLSYAPGYGRQPIETHYGTVYVRVEEVDAEVGAALDLATPKPGEFVMNTHPLDSMAKGIA